MPWITDHLFRIIDGLGAAEVAKRLNVEPERVRLWRAGAVSIPVSAAEALIEEESLRDPIKTQRAEWEGRKIAFLLPWYKSVHPATAFSVMGLFEKGKTACIMHSGDAFIAHTRNYLVNQFLDTGIEWALMVDDDMVLPWGNGVWFNKVTGMNLPEQFAGMHTANRLLAANKSLVGALYFGRHRGGKPMYHEACANPGEAEMIQKHAPMDNVKATSWLGTGCLLVNRKVFLDIERTFPNLARKPDGRNMLEKSGHWFTSSEHDLRKGLDDAIDILKSAKQTADERATQAIEHLLAALKKSQRNSQLGMGEDVQFCIRAAQSGHQPFVDLGLLCGHMGQIGYPLR